MERCPTPVSHANLLRSKSNLVESLNERHQQNQKMYTLDPAFIAAYRTALRFFFAYCHVAHHIAAQISIMVAGRNLALLGSPQDPIQRRPLSFSFG